MVEQIWSLCKKLEQKNVEIRRLKKKTRKILEKLKIILEEFRKTVFGRKKRPCKTIFCRFI